MKQKLSLLAALILALLIYGAVDWRVLYDGTQTRQSQVEYSANNSSKDSQAQGQKETYSFRTKDLLEAHYQKHGAEFGDITLEEYLQGANQLINSRSPELLTKYEAEDGDKLFYIERTNEFLVLSADGYIRTYFKPKDGIAYFNRQ